MDSIIKKIKDFKREDIPQYEPYLMLGGGTPGVNLVRGQGIYVYDLMTISILIVPANPGRFIWVITIPK